MLLFWTLASRPENNINQKWTNLKGNKIGSIVRSISQRSPRQVFNIVSRYMNEYLSIVDKSGGKYGCCVMCGQAADNYCRITKASLCGLDCKKKHI